MPISADVLLNTIPCVYRCSTFCGAILSPRRDVGRTLREAAVAISVLMLPNVYWKSTNSRCSSGHMNVNKMATSTSTTTRLFKHSVDPLLLMFVVSFCYLTELFWFVNDVPSFWLINPEITSHSNTQLNSCRTSRPMCEWSRPPMAVFWLVALTARQMIPPTKDGVCQPDELEKTKVTIGQTIDWYESTSRTLVDNTSLRIYKANNQSDLQTQCSIGIRWPSPVTMIWNQNVF